MGAKNVKKTKGKGIYKTVHGERVKLTRNQVSAYIMKVHGWSPEQYKKQRDIFRNKLRAYENYQAAHGKKVTRQSPMEIMYYEARSQKKHGAEYVPSIEMQEIKSFGSVSSGKAGQKLLQGKKYNTRRAKAYSNKVDRQFGEFIKRNAQAKRIADEIKDPVKREQALAAYAEKIHAKIKEEKKKKEDSQQGAIADENVAFGDTFGSEDVLDDKATEIIKAYQ